MIKPHDYALKSLELNLQFAQAGIVEETGRNDGPLIDRVQKIWGLQGEPYCSMGQYYSAAKGYCYLNGIKITEQNIVKVSRDLRDEVARDFVYFHPACAEMIAYASKVRQYVVFDEPTDRYRIMPGDYVFFDFGSRGKPQRHVGQFIKLVGDQLQLVEWNTLPPKAKVAETNDPRGGVFVKLRNPDADVILGWIKANRP